MSNSHASTRLVHGVQLPVSHTGGGERKRSRRLRRGPWMCGNRRPDAVSARRQSPTSACQQASAARAAVSARRMRGPSPTAVTSFMRRSAASSAGAKPPSGPTTIAHGAARAARIEAGQHLGDRRTAAGLVAHQQPPPRRPVGEQAGELHRRAHLGHAEPFGLLRRFDRIGAQPLDVHALDVGVMRQYRLQHGGAQFGRLFGDIVDARPLDRGEAQPDIGLGDLLARALAQPRHGRLLAAALERGAPFAVAAVEQQERRAVGPAHDVAQIVDLRLAQRRLAARREIGLDEETRHAHGVRLGSLRPMAA